MIYKIDITKRASKELETIKQSSYINFKRIIAVIERLKKINEPHLHSKAEKIKAFNDNRYRWKAGNYRIIGKVKKETITIIIVEIGHRKEVYEKNKRQ